jgi:ubiquinol-cytochrome c reductase cytochrome b subunit
MLVMRHGISEPPVPGKPVNPKTYRKEYEEHLKKDGVPFWPDAAWRDAVFAVAMMLGILALSVFIGPPEIGAPPDPSSIQADPRPDWYLLWVFALNSLAPSSLEAVVILGMPLVVGGLLMAPPLISNRGERSPWKRPWAIASVTFAVLMVGSLWIVGAKSSWSPNFEAKPLTADIVGATSGPVAEGAKLFHDKGCLNCHLIENEGGRRGPNLSHVGDKLSRDEMIIRISNGGKNMPGFSGTLTPDELDRLATFLQSRRAK